MEKDLNKFITSIRANVKPFVYAAPNVNKHFMLSYDESIDALENEDFRPYIIAALHARGATNIKSYVASTIIFTAPVTENKSAEAVKNWKGYLGEVFNNEVNTMIGVLAEYSDGTPIFDKVANQSIESEFDSRVTTVMDKFKNLIKQI